MKECDISRGSKHTLTPPTDSQGSRQDPQPRIYAHACIAWGHRLLQWPVDVVVRIVASDDVMFSVASAVLRLFRC